MLHKRYLIGLFVLGVLLSACGRDNLKISSTFTPSVQPSQTARIFTQAAPTVVKSGDCQKIAFVLSNNGSSNIATVCPDGSGLTQLTQDPSPNRDPAWSPDGSQIAFTSSRTGSSQIYLMSKNGSNPVKITTDYENDEPIWLPHGNQIAFRTTDGKGLWWWRILGIETHAITQYTRPSYDFFYQRPAWSPDGQKIATMSLVEQKQRNDGSSQIHIHNTDGSQDMALTSDTWANIRPIWSPDGQKIAFVSERDGTYNLFTLYVMAKDGTGLRKLTQPIYSENVTFTWSPDGQQIAIDSEGSNISILNIGSGSSRKLLDLQNGQTASLPSWQP